jgi:putative serine protease PepD
MSEQQPPSGEPAQPSEHTHRYEFPSYSFGPPTPAPPPPGRRERPVSKGLVAGLMAGALVVGVVGGVAGAAGFDLADGGSSTVASSRTTSSVVSSRPNSTAAVGTPERVAAEVLPSVVKIDVVSQQGAGSGSGIILSSDGEILTNAHVVEGAGQDASLTVSFNDGSTADAKVVGIDELTDLAVIKAEDVSDLTPATIGSSDDLAVGQAVVAIGSPFGLQATVTSGIVSALNRPVSVGQTASGLSTTYPAIQTDAAINPGNSGGPLVNLAGQVVGVNSSIRTSSSSTEQGGSIGLGFAIPISRVLPVVDQLRNGDTPTHARLGVTVADASQEDGLVTGARLQSVTGGSAADDAGLREGDVITKVDDEVVTGSESLVATIRGYRPGDEVTITYQRDGETRTTKVSLDSDEGQATS